MVEFYAKYHIYELIDLEPAPRGLIHASVWKMTGYNAVVVVLAGHKNLEQEQVSFVTIRIKRALTKKIREDGSIWLNENEYELIHVATKSKKPETTGFYTPNDEPLTDIDIEWFGLEPE